MARPRIARAPIIQPSDPTIKLIPLTRGKVAVVDVEDYESLIRFSWCAQLGSSGIWYAVRGVSAGGQRLIKMHREIMAAPDGVLVDHRDRDGLNNRKTNLRWCDKRQNAANALVRRHSTTGLKGVYFNKQNRNYNAYIKAEGKRQHIGCFPTPEAAARAYRERAKEVFGEFART